MPTKTRVSHQIFDTNDTNYTLYNTIYIHYKGPWDGDDDDDSDAMIISAPINNKWITSKHVMEI